jgi:hypothetical protein
MNLTLSEITQIAKDVFEGHVNEKDMDFFLYMTLESDSHKLLQFKAYAYMSSDLDLIETFASRLDEAAQNKTSKNI